MTDHSMRVTNSKPKNKTNVEYKQYSDIIWSKTQLIVGLFMDLFEIKWLFDTIFVWMWNSLSLSQYCMKSELKS